MKDSRLSSLSHPLWLGLLGLVLGLAGALAAYGIGRALRPPLILRGAMLDPVVPAVDFTLEDWRGNERSLMEFRGLSVLLAFTCLDCPQADNLLSTLAEARKQVLSENQDVQVILVDANPSQKEAQAFTEFVQSYDASFLALTGKSGEIQDIANSYDIYFADDGEDPTPELIPLIMLIDDQGAWRAVYPLALGAADIAGDIEILLKESKNHR